MSAWEFSEVSEAAAPRLAGWNCASNSVAVEEHSAAFGQKRSPEVGAEAVVRTPYLSHLCVPISHCRNRAKLGNGIQAQFQNPAWLP